MKKKISKEPYFSKKRIKHYLVFLGVTIATYLIISPDSFSTSFISVILFGIATGLSLAFFFSMIVSRDKSYVQALQDQSYNDISVPLKKVETSIKHLTKSVDSTKSIITKKQSSFTSFPSLPINFSIISSSSSDDAYILDKEFKIPLQSPQEKSIYDKLVGLLKKNGHHIRILKPYNPTYKMDMDFEDDIESGLACSSLSSDFPQNLINFN